MSFFKDFKDDLNQAVNELANDETAENNENLEAELNDIVNTLDEGEDVEVVAEEETPAPAPAPVPTPAPAPQTSPLQEETSDEVAEISKGMTVEGNISAIGSINLNGKVKGDVNSNGKLSINGEIVGNSQAKEIFTNNARVVGDVVSSGSVKIGNGTIIIGNVSGTSAVIAGAIKGEVDIKGPVIVDATAIVQGNIKSKSVQINNGAVIDGHCSQCYADVDFDKLFGDTFDK